MEEYMAKISFFAFNWCPRYYNSCEGQLLSISENQTLYALLGTAFGGNGVQNFALPDLRGRVIVGQGTSNYGSSFPFAQMGGSPSAALSTNNLPAHTHAATLNLENASTTIKVSDADGTSKKASTRSGATLGALVTSTDKLYNGETPNVDLNVEGNTVTGTVSIADAGNSQAFNIIQPYVTLNPCILVNGQFPPRT